MSLKPVVFVPGFPGSELRKRSSGRKVFPPEPNELTSNKRKEELVRRLCAAGTAADELTAGPPIRQVLSISKQADSLYEKLQEYGYTTQSGDNFRPVGWDWRKGVDDPEAQGAVEAAIDELAARNGGARVVLLVHSTGGLVARSLLESRPQLARKIGHILAFGVPWAGTLKSVRYLAKGERFGFPPASLSASEVRQVMRHAQAAYDLFPPNPARTDLTDASGAPLRLFVGANGRQIAPLVDLGWAGASPDAAVVARAAIGEARLGARTPELRFGGETVPPVTNVVGWGAPTDIRCSVDGSGRLEFHSENSGDGTVPAASAAWIRGATIQTHFIPVGIYPSESPRRHSRLWDAPPTYALFDRVLRDAAPEPLVSGAADADEGCDRQGDAVTFRFAASDADGAPLTGATIQIPRLQIPRKGFRGGVRLDLSIPRSRLRPNAGELLRFDALIEWDAGAREVPFLIPA